MLSEWSLQYQHGPRNHLARRKCLDRGESGAALRSWTWWKKGGGQPGGHPQSLDPPRAIVIPCPGRLMSWIATEKRAEWPCLALRGLTVDSYWDVNRGVINPGWVTWARVSVVARPEISDDLRLRQLPPCDVSYSYLFFIFILFLMLRCSGDCCELVNTLLEFLVISVLISVLGCAWSCIIG